MQEVENICEACEWKTRFDPEEIVGIISFLLETEPDLFESNSSKAVDITEETL